MLVTFSFFLCGINIYHAADSITLIDNSLHSGCRMDSVGFCSHSFCVSDKDCEYCSFIKIVTQLSCCDGLGAVGCEIGQAPTALFDGNATAEKFFCKVFKADSIRKCYADFFTELVFVCFKLGLFDGQALFGKLGIFFIQCKLFFLLRPILTLGHSGLTSVQKINLIQTCIVAHLHDLGTKVFHSCVGTSVLLSMYGMKGTSSIRRELITMCT